MDFLAYAKSVKTDLTKKKITVSFEIPLDDESLHTAKLLAPFARGEAGAVRLEIMPYQQTLITESK